MITITDTGTRPAQPPPSDVTSTLWMCSAIWAAAAWCSSHFERLNTQQLYYGQSILYFLNQSTAVFQVGPIYLGAQTALPKGGRTPKPSFRNI